MKSILILTQVLVLGSFLSSAQAVALPALARTQAIETVSRLYEISDRSDSLSCDLEKSVDGTETSNVLRDFRDIMLSEIMTIANDADNYKNSTLEYPFQVTQDPINPQVFTVALTSNGFDNPNDPREEYDSTLTYKFTLSKSLSDPATRVVAFVRSNDFATKKLAADGKTVSSVEVTPRSSIVCRAAAEGN